MDSFAKAQARHDNSEHPDFYRDDAAEERFDAALAAEIRAQVEADDELRAMLLAERLSGEDIRLIGNPNAFAERCQRLTTEAVDSFCETMKERAYTLLTGGRFREATVGEIAQRAISLN